MFRNIKIGTVHDRTFQKPACTSLINNWLSTSFSIRIRMILVNTLDVIDNRVTPCQLLQSNRSPFFGSFCDESFFCQSRGIFSSSQVISNGNGRATFACSMSAFSSFAGSSTPGFVVFQFLY